MEPPLQSDTIANEVDDTQFFNGLTNEDIVQMEWVTEGDAYDFYERYGLSKGFGTRKDRYKRKRNGELLWRSFVCACEGHKSVKDSNTTDRKKANRPITRCGCPATLRIEQNNVRNCWNVNKFVDDHNHPLLHRRISCFHRSHRTIDGVDASQVNTLHNHMMKTSHIMSLMASQSGGFTGVGFTKTDMYNHIDRQRRRQICDGDAKAALHYLMARKENENGFFIKHTIDKDGCLDKLFWADGTSRIDYKCFGDVVAFDSTYKKNKYNKPLVIFSGINHHEQSIVFACCLLSDETEDSYKWLLQTLIESMEEKKPVSVVTDGDKSMRNAIIDVFPEANHRLCSWHLQRNAQSNTKNKEFVKMFGSLAKANIDVDDFESKWAELVGKCGLQDNEWVKELYTKRHLWASAHMRGKLMCGFTTTSRCEGINGYIGNYVDRNYNLLEFVQHIHQALDSMRYSELQADYNSQFGKFVLCTAHIVIERSAAALYTKEAFKVLQSALHEASAWTVDQIEDVCGTRVYQLRRYLASNKRFRVCYDPVPVRQRMQCQCGMLQSHGMPCPHLLCVMAYEDFECLSPSVVNRIWTKNVKQVEMESIDFMTDSSSYSKMDLVKTRMATLGHSMRRLNYIACQRTEDFNATRDQVHQILTQLELKHGDQMTVKNVFNCDVGDPPVVQLRGQPVGDSSREGRPRKCGRCKQIGHNRATCKLLLSEGSTDCSTPSFLQDYE